MKNALKISLLALAALAAAACTKNPVKDDPTTPSASVDYLVLCEGGYGQNNATVYYYCGDTPYSFEDKNGYPLGDTAQDIIALSDGGYAIAVYGSGLVYFTDENLQVTATVTTTYNGTQMTPRALAEKDGVVYATLYEGWLCKISDREQTTYLEIGPNPEGVAIVGNYAYVANSGGMAYDSGYNNTVSKVDLSDFTVEKEITVYTNPINVRAMGDKVYVHYNGNYSDVAAGVCCIDTSDDSVANVDVLSGTGSIDIYQGDKLVCLTVSYDASWNTVGNVICYDPADGSTTTLQSGLSNSYTVCADEDCYIVCYSDYTTTGSFEVFETDAATGTDDDTGVSYSAQGLNPRKVLAVY